MCKSEAFEVFVVSFVQNRGSESVFISQEAERKPRADGGSLMMEGGITKRQHRVETVQRVNRSPSAGW